MREQGTKTGMTDYELAELLLNHVDGRLVWVYPRKKWFRYEDKKREWIEDPLYASRNYDAIAKQVGDRRLLGWGKKQAVINWFRELVTVYKKPGIRTIYKNGVNDGVKMYLIRRNKNVVALLE